MNKTVHQLDLFSNIPLDPTHEIKRNIRLSLAGSALSREQIVDTMNDIASSEGLTKRITKATLDSWCKESDMNRLPSLVWLTIFCHVMKTLSPIEAVLRPLRCGVIDMETMRVLEWARAEMAKKKATRKARMAWERIENGD